MTNEITTHQSGGVSTWLSPTSFEKAMQIAELMAKCGTLPAHIKGNPSDCFRIVIQAAKWKIDPFAVAECTSLVHGRMCFEGKLVASVLQSMNAIEGKLKYEHKGDGQNMSIVVTGTPRGGTPVSITGSVKEWRTRTYKDNKELPNAWDKDPFSMLVYRGTRQWTRVYCPEVIMGIYTPDEMEEIKEVEGTVIPEAKEPRRRTVTVKTLEGEAKTDAAPVVAVTVTNNDPPVVDFKPKRDALNALALSLVKQYGDAAKTAFAAIRKRHEVSGVNGIPDDKLDEAMKDLERLEADLAEDAGKAS